MKPVIMKATDYLNEHQHLVKLLLSAHKPAFTKEAKNQIKEVKSRGMVI